MTATSASSTNPKAGTNTKPKAFTLKVAKQRFLDRLHALGIPEWELIVAPMRKSRNGNPIGYYSYMSQFRSRPRMVVDFAYIEGRYLSQAVIEEEVLLTIAHEYGHIIAESLAHVNRTAATAAERFDVPDWKTRFDGDEEEFAEDFARFCITDDSEEEGFWEKFVPQYGREFRRIFEVTEVAK